MNKTEYETSEQRCSTPTPTNSDAPNGADPNSENGTEKGPNNHSLRKEKKSQSRRRETHHHPRKLPEKLRSGWTLYRSDLNAIFSSDNVITLKEFSMVPFKSAWIECFLPCIMACFASLADDIGEFRLKIFNVIHVNQPLR